MSTISVGQQNPRQGHIILITKQRDIILQTESFILELKYNI